MVLIYFNSMTTLSLLIYHYIYALEFYLHCLVLNVRITGLVSL